MKFTRIKIILLAAAVFAGNFLATAQSNPPGDADYAKFSGFITDRNIFDPNRVPHNSRSTPTRTRTRTRTKSAGTPGITLVGTMSYEKGLFAFFNATDSDLKKILPAGGELAGYTVKEVSATAVTLVGADKKEFIMKIGDQLHQDGNVWKLSDEPVSSAPASEPVAAAAESESSAGSSAEAPAAAPAANFSGNDVLKRLMEKRAKENQ
ncbi:MAG: hypothetical protein RL616_1273 [Verrucomicrobiota bacterium]|jgi:hypothetical protein